VGDRQRDILPERSPEYVGGDQTKVRDINTMSEMTYLHSPGKWEAGDEKMKRLHSNGERRLERCAKGDARRGGEGQWARKRK